MNILIDQIHQARPALLLIALSLFPALVLATPPAEREQALRHLIKHDCGSCHGMTLQGGLGPALTAERLKPYSVPLLAATILYGRTGTPMPPWRPFISAPEAQWIATQLKNGNLP